MPQPFDNLQPSLALTEVIVTTGLLPQTAGSASGDTIGFIENFAGNYAPGGSVLADGQLIPASGNASLSGVIGTNFGDDGEGNFGVPDLQGEAMIGTGRYDFENYNLGDYDGSPEATLTAVQISPSELDVLPFNNYQPSLPLQTIICISGQTPTTGSQGNAVFIGQVAQFAGSVIPAGWALCNGQSLSTATNAALYQVIGTTYGGGNGSFNLPNLQGVAITGVSASHPVGSTYGSDYTTPTANNLAPASAPLNNDEPSMAMEYLICTSGLYPGRDDEGPGFDPTQATLGEVVAFSGGIVPAGWSLCNGQTLSISSNAALFSIIGTNYGGNGTTNFALPNLTGRTIIGAGTDSYGDSANNFQGDSYTLGQAYGADSVTLNAAQSPVCFYPGTNLATADGDIRVEDITPGTMLKTVSGDVLPVRWLGRSDVSTRFAAPLCTLPIRFKAGALGENIPARDLLVSPCHAMFIGGVLIQAGALVNGTTIIREHGVPERFSYYHVELATHELLLAEGAPTESFVDNVDRFSFANWDEHESIVAEAPVAEMHYPRAKSWRQVPMAVRQQLSAHAGGTRAGDSGEAGG